MRLLDKVILITGATRGIGKAFAVEMAKEGALAMITGIDMAAARKVAAEIHQFRPGAAEVFLLDVTKRTQVNQVVSDILQKYGRIDVLINNAGIAATTKFLDTDESEWDQLMNTNLKSVYFCCQAVIPGMIERRSGKIINISSVAAKVGGGLLGTTVYAASKAGMIGLSKGLARELAPYGINVNVIAPGSINTDITKKFLTEQQQSDSIARIPLGRRGNIQDLVGAAILLASPESDFITGATIDINGGTLMD